MKFQLKASGLLMLALAVGACGGDDPGGDNGPIFPGGGGVDASTSPSLTPDATTPGPTTPGPTTPGPTTPGPTTPGPTTPGPTTPGPTTPGPTTPKPDGGTPEAGPVTSPEGGTPEAGPVEPTPGGGEGAHVRGPEPTEQTTMANGPFKFTSYTTGFQKAAGVDSSTVWYPTEGEGTFSGIAVVPGFVSPESSIREWGPFLASHGIIAVTIGVPGGDQPGQRKTKLLGTLESLKKENTRSGSPIMGKVDVNRLAVSGWSMGGGGTLMAAAETPSLKAAMSFAAWGPSGGRNNKVPSLMFEATADVLAAGMSDGFHRDTPATTPKILFEVQGSSHNVANSPKNHNNIIGSWGLSWLKVFLDGDERYRKLLMRPFPSICTNKCASNVK